MMSIVRRSAVAAVVWLTGVTTVAAIGAIGATAGGGVATASASQRSAPSSLRVRTVLGPRTLDQPGGLALDTAGNLFVADTDHCRVLVVASHSGLLDGVRVTAGKASTLAGGTCTGRHAFGYPSAVAVNGHDDVYVAEATAHRVLEVRPRATRRVLTVVGVAPAEGPAGVGRSTAGLEKPSGVALDAAGNLFIADTAACTVRVLPAVTGSLFGRPVTAGQLTTLAGTGVCGTEGLGGPLASAQLWNPVAVAVDRAGNLLVADAGDQSVLLAAARAGTYWGTAVGAGEIAVVLGGTGSYGPYLADGLPATGLTAELNDPRGLAVGPRDTLFVSDGFEHAVRVVPALSETLFGRAMTAGDLYTAAGAIPVKNAAGTGDGTRWVATRMGSPTGLAVATSGALYVADARRNDVRVIGQRRRTG